MIGNTIGSIEKILRQLKTVNTFRKFFTLLLYSAYLIYRIVAGNGYLVLNIVLLALTCLYGAFYICYISSDRKGMDKKTVQTINKVYRYSKLLFTAIGVGLNVSSFLTVANQGLTVQNLVFAIIMPAFLILQIIFDLLFEYANYCFRVLKKGFQADLDHVKEMYQKPIQVVENVKTTFEGIKNVKNGVVGMASALWKRRKDKKKKPEPEQAPAAPTKEIAATTEEEVIDIKPDDISDPKKQ